MVTTDLSMPSGKTRKDDHAETILAKIDQYELISELGGGGFGTVYLAKDKTSRVQVAVKGLPPFVKNNREELENIRENFALVSRLTHTNIAKALVLHPAKEVSYSSEDTQQKLRVFADDFLMVMEYAPGVTLSKWRKQFPDRKVPISDAVAIVRQVASALDYAHGQRIIHRDIKPANVMIETQPDGKLIARVLDFGLAAEIRSSMGRVSREIHDTSGTRPYMAPEQWIGGRQGAATDQYSLAVLFHELVTGDVPFASVFDTGDPMVMLNAIGHNPVELPDDLPACVSAALQKALSKKPSDRFETCVDFVDALEGKAVEPLTIPDHVTKPDNPPPPPPRPFPVGKIAISLFVMVAIGFSGWLIMFRTTHRDVQIPLSDQPTPHPQQIPSPQPTPPQPSPAPVPKVDEALKSEVIIMKGKASQASDRNAKEEWHSWPHFDTRAKDVESFYRSGVEAFDKANYKLAKEMFNKVRENMRWLDANKKARGKAADSRARAESAKADAQRHNAAQYASSYWQSATDAFSKASNSFDQGEFAEAQVEFDDAQRQFANAAKQAIPRERESNWHQGSPHPHNPNLVADVGLDTWRSTRPGYVWVEGTDRDEWKSGIQHPDNSKLRSDWQEGKWKSTVEGYVWTGGSQTEWRAGIASKEHPHWVSVKSEEHPSGYWRPAPGYVKRDKDADGLSELVWKEGVIDGDRKSAPAEGVWLERCPSCNGKGQTRCEICDGEGWKSSRCSNCNDGFTHETEKETCTDCLLGFRFERCANNCVKQMDGNWYLRCNCNECMWMPNGAHGKQMGFMFQPCNQCGGRGMVMCPNKGHMDNGAILVGKCNTCNGTVQKTVRKKVRCGRCDGTGLVKNRCSNCTSGKVRCRRCDGTGWK